MCSKLAFSLYHFLIQKRKGKRDFWTCYNPLLVVFSKFTSTVLFCMVTLALKRHSHLGSQPYWQLGACSRDVLFCFALEALTHEKHQLKFWTIKKIESQPKNFINKLTFVLDGLHPKNLEKDFVVIFWDLATSALIYRKCLRLALSVLPLVIYFCSCILLCAFFLSQILALPLPCLPCSWIHRAILTNVLRLLGWNFI